MYEPATSPPMPTSLTHLRARDGVGFVVMVVVGAVSAAGLALSVQAGWIAWVLGQLPLALAFLQWFVVLHEAGHKFWLTCLRWAKRLSGMTFLFGGRDQPGFQL